MPGFTIKLVKRSKRLVVRASGLRGPVGPAGAQGPPGGGLPNGGVAGQYLRKNSATNGDASFATITKSEVGLGNVDDTSDATKNSATATLSNKTIDGGTY